MLAAADDGLKPPRERAGIAGAPCSDPIRDKATVTLARPRSRVVAYWLGRVSDVAASPAEFSSAAHRLMASRRVESTSDGPLEPATETR